MFITFEGIEGSGKTTQIKLLAEWFEKNGRSVLMSREPGATPFGKKIRELVLDPDQVFNSTFTELLLFYADRLEHVETLVKPALAQGQIVLCDRFLDSTEAYQIGGRGIEPKWVNQLNDMIDLRPNLTLFLDINCEEGLKRAKQRAELDRFEHESLVFHNKVRQQYTHIAKREAARFKSVDVNGLTPQEVHQKVLSIIQKEYSL